jgi:hypothetical protein
MFVARSAEAMKTQTEIVNYHNKMAMIRVVAPYGASVAFAMIAALLIIFAPDSRTTAANTVAGVFVVLALGIAGFTRFSAKLPGLEFKGDRPSKSN